MALPVLSTKLLVGQSVVADPSQPNLAPFSGSGVIVPNPGVAAVSVEKLGLLSTTHHVKWSAGVLVGEVTIECSGEVNDTDPWSPLYTLTFSGQAPKQDSVVINGTFGALRHRITVPVAGGSVTTKVTGTT